MNNLLRIYIEGEQSGNPYELAVNLEYSKNPYFHNLWSADLHNGHCSGGVRNAIFYQGEPREAYSALLWNLSRSPNTAGRILKTSFDIYS